MYRIPAPFSSDATPLLFEKDHPCSTKIRNGATGMPLYVVDTEAVKVPKKKTVTRIRRATGETLATFEWKYYYKSDHIRFGSDEEPTLSSDWLKKSSIPFIDTVSFKDERWKGYKWKGNSPGEVLELYSETENTRPMARFVRETGRNRSKREDTEYLMRKVPAALIVDQSLAMDVAKLDHVVLTFLYLEKIKRDIEEIDFRVELRSSRR